MKRRLSSAGFVLALSAALLALARAQTPGTSPRSSTDHGSPARSVSMALTGDSIITRRLSIYQEPEFMKMIEIIRGADVAFTNLEMLFHDYEPYPMTQSGGTYMRADPALVKDLVWAGFDMVARANNHAGDYGVLGMNLTTEYVAKAGLVQAGVGNSLAEAREAKFLETPKARIALISVASTFTDHSRAGRSRGDMPARPGLNPLRFSTKYTVTPERLETLRGTLKELGLNAPASGTELQMLGHRFVAGDPPGIHTAPNAADLKEIAAVVSNASRLADYTIVSIHAHEAGANNFVPAEFLVTFAHAMIEAGADVFVGSGPHVLRAIELYKGKPIFYSLANFIFENEGLLRLPTDNYEPLGLGDDAHVADFNDRRYDFDRRGFPAQEEIWESIVAVPRFEGRILRDIRLYPISLGFKTSRSERGRPMLASPQIGRKILDDLTRLSAPFGTRVLNENNVGRVEIAPPTSSAAR